MNVNFANEISTTFAFVLSTHMCTHSDGPSFSLTPCQGLPTHAFHSPKNIPSPIGKSEKSFSLSRMFEPERRKKKRKMLYARWKILLNISEVVCVWHFPHTFRGVKSNMMYKFTKRNSFKYTQLGYRFSHTLFRLLLVHV